MSDCTHPKTAWKKKDVLESYRFDLPPPKEKNLYEKVQVRCDKCDKCLKVKSNEWAVRCAMEIAMHDKNSFLTLTYDEGNHDESLRPEHMTKFIKRVRNHLTKHNIPQKIRYYQCGEYGTKTHRPHHHVLLFGYEFPDMTMFFKNSNGDKLYTSEILNKLWPYGHCTIGEANLATAIYTAGYIGKKIYGKKDANGTLISGGSKNTNYTKVDYETGEIIELHKEYATMSTANGLGYSYFQKYKTDMFPKGYIHMPSPTGDLKPYPVPNYFYKKLAEEDPELYLQSQAARIEYATRNEQQKLAEQTPERRATKAKYARLTSTGKQRDLGHQEHTPIDLTDIDENIERDNEYQERLLEQELFEQLHANRLQSKIS
jgi:hypothetical protein